MRRESNRNRAIIVAGGRDFADYDLLCKTMDEVTKDITGNITIVCGMAKGADTLGEKYGKERGFGIHYFPADWEHNGKTAGFIRNVEMAKNADTLVAFWDGQSKGTAHMIRTARSDGLTVHVVPYGNVQGQVLENA